MQTQMQLNTPTPKRSILQELFFQFEPLIIIPPLGTGVFLSFTLYRTVSLELPWSWLQLPLEFDPWLISGLVVLLFTRAWEIYEQDRVQGSIPIPLILTMFKVCKCGMSWPMGLKGLLLPAILSMKKLGKTVGRQKNKK